MATKLTAKQLTELNAAAKRVANGTASAADKANLAFAKKTYGYNPPSSTVQRQAAAGLAGLGKQSDEKSTFTMAPGTIKGAPPTPIATGDQVGYDKYIAANGGRNSTSLPMKDAAGKRSWIDANGKEQHEEGYDPNTGSWKWLGTHTQTEWGAAQVVAKSIEPPVNWKDMSDATKQEFLGQAHQEMSRKFINDINQGRSDAAHDAGLAITAFADDLKQNNLALTGDLATVRSALSAAGLTFSGAGAASLGQGFSATGVLTPDQMATIQGNLANINALPGTAVIPGQPAAVGSAMPQPEAIKNGTAKTDAEKQAAWEAFYQTPEWKSYQDSVTAMSTSGTNEGVAGTGQYGFTGNLDPYANTGIAENAQGSVFRGGATFGLGNVTGRTNIAESARRSFNQNMRTIGTNAESLLGSSNINSGMFGSFGGQNVVSPAANVLGSAQSGYTTNVNTRAGEQFGNAFGNEGYTFSI